MNIQPFTPRMGSFQGTAFQNGGTIPNPYMPNQPPGGMQMISPFGQMGGMSPYGMGARGDGGLSQMMMLLMSTMLIMLISLLGMGKNPKTPKTETEDPETPEPDP